MAEQRFRAGDAVTHVGTRCPCGVRRFELTVITCLMGGPEQCYLLADGATRRVTFAEGELFSSARRERSHHDQLHPSVGTRPRGFGKPG